MAVGNSAGVEGLLKFSDVLEVWYILCLIRFQRQRLVFQSLLFCLYAYKRVPLLIGDLQSCVS